MQSYYITIINKEGQVLAVSRRKGTFTPNSLELSLQKENPMWRGVLYETCDSEVGIGGVGIGGDVALEGGNFCLVLEGAQGNVCSLILKWPTRFSRDPSGCCLVTP